MSLTYKLYCEWFLKTFGRPFAASEAEFEAALRQPRYEQVDDLDITVDIKDPNYHDGEEEREGLYR